MEVDTTSQPAEVEEATKEEERTLDTMPGEGDNVNVTVPNESMS